MSFLSVMKRFLITFFAYQKIFNGKTFQFIEFLFYRHFCDKKTYEGYEALYGILS